MLRERARNYDDAVRGWDSRLPHVLIIFDSGADAVIVRLPSATTLRVGDLLHHGGEMWRITARRPHAKAFVARPLAQ